ncbi:hypothetical protein [Corynebacterium sp. HMSC28B08]|uniref:hypothetical protein n=1 Tax=Corynebacterium sp. HMSC28B08 TaxID=1581066 RepID=UPI0008A447B0|nr:hypothetical protein [Corynebacterium sp. HMSC28B08]OFT88998.1 hypothetical protein HMPREF3098_06795 [Corynebacterium sp. HMSC28B08]
MTAYDYRKIAAIVGEDKIDALRKAGVQIGEKPKKPTTGLLGRWAKHEHYGDVLVIGDKLDECGCALIAFPDPDYPNSVLTPLVILSDLTFPEETTRPEDVPVGEAWLVNVDDGADRECGVVALKFDDDGNWYTREVNGCTTWYDSEVTLIAPLVSARPADPETVTTEKEYAALPAGSIVAGSSSDPFLKNAGIWIGPAATRMSNSEMARKTRRILRWGWGK